MLKSNQILVRALPLLLLAVLGQSYIDITLEIAISSSDISYNVPLKINSEKEVIGLSLENKEEFIVLPEALKHKGKQLKTRGANNSNKGELHVSSLEGYTLEGWKRFFIEVFTFSDSRYYHQIAIDLTSIKKVEKYIPLTNGIMTLGPKLAENKLYQLIKGQTTEYFKEDIVSFYTTPGGKELRLQLGGYEEQNARGYKNGIRFYEKPIETSEDKTKWLIPISKLVITKERGSRWDSFVIPSSNIKPKLSLESQFVIFPIKFKEDLETSF
jgi:hypothetical protein